jgi:demethylmenaquinone methyltransferase/2-methoxy-6-polyprenyl-1,4-benzoquinol methylase
MVEYYAQRAREYERIYQKPERQEELLELKDLVRTSLAGRNILEVACGTGYWTEVAAATAASITAFDINESVLEIARAKPLDQTGVTFLAGDAYCLPAFPRPFDAALVTFLWSHIPKARLAGFLNGLHGALSPDAVVLFIDNTYVEGNSTHIARRDDEGNTYQHRHLENGTSFEVLKNHPTHRELCEALRDFAVRVEVQWLKHYWFSICRIL